MEIQEIDDSLLVSRYGSLIRSNIKAIPYPGFPTDLQSVVLAVETKGRGVSRIRETIFENRFRIVEELR